jgi:ATP-dependent DNA helicase RecG
MKTPGMRSIPPDVIAAIRAVAEGASAKDHETPTLDFTTQQASSEDTARHVAEMAACLANSDGGSIVIGVNDRGAGPAAFAGCDLDSEGLRRRIWDLCNPHLTTEVSLVREHGRTLLVVHVPQGLELHAIGSRVRHRVGTSCEPMSSREQAREIDRRLGTDWSEQSTDRPASDASPIALEAARRLLVAAGRSNASRKSDADVLRILGVVDGSSRLRRAGQILFCDAAAGAPPLVVYQYRSTPAGEPRDIVRAKGPLLVTLRAILDRIEGRIETTPIDLPGGQQVALADLPLPAVREALVNAVAHRDYRLQEPVTVDQSPTSFRVVSPGPFVPGVTPQNVLTHPSKPRNRVLMSAIRTLGLAEEAGLGIDRMVREMIRFGHRPPEIAEEADQVRVTLMGGAPKKVVARFVAELPAEEAEDTDTLLVLFALLTSRTVDARSLAPRLQKTEAEAEEVLRRLASDLVRMVEPSRETVRRRHPAYRLREGAVQALAPLLTYRRRTPDEIDRKVVAHVEEYGRITNKTVQRMLDVRVVRASVILGDLVERGILEKTTVQERGPGVEYGPGKKFPRSRRKRVPRRR